MKNKIMVLAFMLMVGVQCLAAPKKQSFERSSTGPKYDKTVVGFGRGTTRLTPGTPASQQEREMYIRSNSSKSNSDEKSVRSIPSDSSLQADTAVVDQGSQVERNAVDRGSQTEQTYEQSFKDCKQDSYSDAIDFGLFPDDVAYQSNSTSENNMQYSDRDYTDDDFNEPTIWQVLREKFGRKQDVVPTETAVQQVAPIQVAEPEEVAPVHDVIVQPTVSTVSMMQQQNTNHIVIGISVVLVVGVVYWAYKKGYFSFAL